MAVVEYQKAAVDTVKGIYDFWGNGSPATTLASAAPGSLYRQLDGGSGSLLWQRTTSAWEALGTSAFNQTFADGRYVQLAGSTMNASARLLFPVLTTNSQLVVGTMEAQGYALNNGWLGENVYFDGSNVRLRAAGVGAQLYFTSSGVQIRLFATGSAGAAVSPTSTYDFAPARLNIPGYLTVGAFAGSAPNAGDVVSRRSSTTGVYYFGDANSKYLYYDGTSFNFSGGNVLSPNQICAETYFCVTRATVAKAYYSIATSANQMITGSATDDICIRAAVAASRILFSVDDGVSIATQITTNGAVNAKGQLRATGWWASGDSVGMGAELGISGGAAYLYCYDRTAGAYGVMTVSGSVVNLVAATTSIDINAVTFVTVHASSGFQYNDNTNTVRDVACQVVSASAASGTAPAGTIWFQT